jgi:hypothetical protein
MDLFGIKRRKQERALQEKQVKLTRQALDERKRRVARERALDDRYYADSVAPSTAVYHDSSTYSDYTDNSSSQCDPTPTYSDSSYSSSSYDSGSSSSYDSGSSSSDSGGGGGCD